MSRVMGIDFGTKRVGIALSDVLKLTAHGYETIHWNGMDDTYLVNKIIEIVQFKEVDVIVLGLPSRTDGKQSESEVKARELGSKLESATKITPVYYDERYTTVIASQFLQSTSMSQKKQRSVIDQVAAEIILREFLEKNRKA